MPKQKPTIDDVRVIAQSRLFTIESLELTFSNGAKRTYERMQPNGRDAVMLVPITAEGDLLLIREYAVGTESYELGFPKGLIDIGETAEQAANRELQEEVGYGANQLIPLKQVTIAPSFLSSKMTFFIAQDLYSHSMQGDEPEELEVVRWPLAQAEELISHLDFSEARCISALMLALKWLQQNQ